MKTSIPKFLDASIDQSFPNPQLALDEPNGLLAVGGDLSHQRLLDAYQQGIFPWFDDDQPILWWSPDPRMVLPINELHISNSTIKQIRQEDIFVSFDLRFREVIEQCQAPRLTQSSTWITDKMIEAYVDLFKRGHAHSIEIWKDKRLVGGLYGVSVGQLFCGESMFNLENNMAKIAFVCVARALKKWRYQLLDAQVPSTFLSQFGCKTMARDAFIVATHQLTKRNPSLSAWPRQKISARDIALA